MPYTDDMEKMKPGKSSKLDETPTTPELPDVSAPPEGGDEILDNLHHATERHRGSHIGKEEISVFHKSIERSEFGPLFDQYKVGAVPSPDRMFGSLKTELAKAQTIIEEERAVSGEEGARELVRIHGLLAGRERELASAVSLYVQSLIRHRNLRRMSESSGHTRDFTEQFVRADHARRRAHEALLTTLRVYREMLLRAKEEGLLSEDSYVEWQLGSDARSIPQDKIVAFGATAVADRDFVRDWALVVDFANQLNKLEGEGA